MAETKSISTAEWIGNCIVFAIIVAAIWYFLGDGVIGFLKWRQQVHAAN